MTPPRRGTAVVTGAAGGLGRAIATALHTDGWSVLLTDLDPVAVAAAAAPLGGWSAALDVRDEVACAEVAATAASRGGLDLWVNNAGILVTGPAWDHDGRTRRRVLDVNTFGAMNGTLAALALMREQGHGHVLNVVSLAGLIAAPGETVYAASKHALLAFSLGTLSDLRMAGYRRVHVSCLCPDGIWTPMLHDRLDDPGGAGVVHRLDAHPAARRRPRGPAGPPAPPGGQPAPLAGGAGPAAGRAAPTRRRTHPARPGRRPGRATPPTAPEHPTGPQLTTPDLLARFPA
ncbi:SDR family oxidoreductase [Micromonospora sp. WMMD710]|uniref:SDR family oxidoreductase n=1 Tax=Micromonospora sp. WMMD710 TaxID=3016085 RepID=UPI002416179C|nr:SDR family oxidoreductase [Micromonospora sp. WMMD710]MDG4760837.1 SDR family NAD(P)-dependent oxidoreductase [Micromonospora sp. WMMD710]